MGRALGAVICVACLLVAIVELYWGLVNPIFLAGVRTTPLAIVLPVVVGVLVIAGLGFWLGWIMVTTKEITPASASSESAPPEEKS